MRIERKRAPRKNLFALLDAFAIVAAESDTLVLIGDGPLKQSLISHSKTIGISERILFVGARAYSDIPKLLAAIDTVILPSAVEVWGLVVNEALAAGRHVIVSDRCGVVRSIDQMLGVFVSTTTPQSIGERMIASRKAWRGPISEPQILPYTPGAFAETFLAAIEATLAK